MGSCCFTPSKKDFLWWYWLLLASIVGIPMLLAVLYVARRPEADEELRKRRGKRAAWIFWVGTFVVAIAAFFVVHIVLASFYPDESGPPFWHNYNYLAGWWILALQFFVATVAANATNDLVRKKRWYWRIPLVVLCVAGYLFALLLPDMVFRRPAINVMQFLVCMLPAHCWGNFKDSPDTRHAWRALFAFLVAAALFFLVSYFGEDFAQWICGPPR
jgi:glycerol uptake facilitator-like aquaporin